MRQVLIRFDGGKPGRRPSREALLRVAFSLRGSTGVSRVGRFVFFKDAWPAGAERRWTQRAFVERHREADRAAQLLEDFVGKRSAHGAAVGR